MSNTRTLSRVASLLVAVVAGCSSEPFADSAGGSEPLCVGHELRVLGGVRPAQPVDFLGLTETALPDRWLDQTGTACATARDAVTCNAKIAEVRKGVAGTIGGGQSGRFFRLVATRGDDVFAVAQTDLLSFLGTVDSSQEAGLVLLGTGYDLPCAPPKGKAASAKSTSDGFVVTTQYQAGICSPSGGLEQREVLVTRDGTSTILEQSTITPGELSSCAGGGGGG